MGATLSDAALLALAVINDPCRCRLDTCSISSPLLQLLGLSNAQHQRCNIALLSSTSGIRNASFTISCTSTEVPWYSPCLAHPAQPLLQQ